ncbi:MAG: DUF4019 domain-containing protein [Brachymonas sp.]|nr:DUF4019 domain-containing protein [Brachymonas sp.]
MRLACLGLASAVATAAHAQNADSFTPNAMLGAALQATQQIDAQQADRLYGQAPAFVKSQMRQAAFASGVTQERAKLGDITMRNWIGIERLLHTPAQNQPPLSCANVRFAAMRGNAVMGFEQISVCWEQQWRTTGYVVTLPQAAPRTNP